MQQVSNIKEIETAINQNGEMVIGKFDNNVFVMSIKEYKEKLQNKEIGKHLLRAEDDIENGRYRNAREVFKEWKEKYGI